VVISEYRAAAADLEIDHAAITQAARMVIGDFSQVPTHRFETVCLPLSYSGNPGANGVLYGGRT